MKKVLLHILCFVMVLAIAGCGSNDATVETESVETTTEEATIIPNDVPEGSEADIAVRETVSEYLDTFISCDFDAISNALHEEDKWLFNFESEDQLAFYNAIFPQIEYEFEFVAEHEGVYGVMTQITSPDMAEVYGAVITNYIDTYTENNSDALSEIVANNTETMLEMLVSPSLSRRVERLYIYVQYIDGEYIPRCDMYLANELTGGAPEISSELTSTINETVELLGE